MLAESSDLVTDFSTKSTAKLRAAGGGEDVVVHRLREGAYGGRVSQEVGEEEGSVQLRSACCLPRNSDYC